MKLGDKVMTPMGEGWLGECHRYDRLDRITLQDNSYYMYAVHLYEFKRVLYFLKEEIQPMGQYV